MDGPIQPNRGSGTGDKRLKYAFDAGFLSGAHPPDTPVTVDSDNRDSTIPLGSTSESCDSADESKRLADLAASFRVFSESLARMELAEMEMLKAREAFRLEAEKRRLESEAEMTQMLLQTQLQIASLVSRSPSRKRKRGEEDDPSISEREGGLLLSYCSATCSSDLLRFETFKFKL
ncbi:unnamed protein product, partial [Vitis vinifera]|uniref:Uncharacterized protein n=2 Tax=Vitis vinifera TaxID=29760 RepID=D7TR78_VITVI|eukprot:XP_002267302.2 PREDICTED: uncharacterized protein At4g22160 [Vitis vinifera]